MWNGFLLAIHCEALFLLQKVTWPLWPAGHCSCVFHLRNVSVYGFLVEERPNADWYTLPFSSSPFMFPKRVCVCQRRVRVSQPAVWWTWQLSGRLRWGRCSFNWFLKNNQKIICFGVLWLQLTTLLEWTFVMIYYDSVLTDWLRKGVQRRWVSLPEPCPLHPSALALRWRVGLHGPQWWGELQPGSVWVWPRVSVFMCCGVFFIFSIIWGEGGGKGSHKVAQISTLHDIVLINR